MVGGAILVELDLFLFSKHKTIKYSTNKHIQSSVGSSVIPTAYIPKTEWWKKSLHFSLVRYINIIYNLHEMEMMMVHADRDDHHSWYEAII